MDSSPQFPQGGSYGGLTRQLLAARLDKVAKTTSRGDHDLNPGARPGPPYIPAAVLVPLVEWDGGWTVLLTRRTDNLLHHAGQISFPGGHAEPEDNTAEYTALRETEEEIGIKRTHVEILGRLDNYITRTGFSVTPVVGVVTPPIKPVIDPTEVAEVFEVPLDFLMDPGNHQLHSHVYGGRERRFHSIPWGDYFIWGATAGMLVNLCEYLNPPRGT